MHVAPTIAKWSLAHIAPITWQLAAQRALTPCVWVFVCELCCVCVLCLFTVVIVVYCGAHELLILSLYFFCFFFVFEFLLPFVGLFWCCVAVSRALDVSLNLLQSATASFYLWVANNVYATR